jgi:hypothetical protein
MKRLRAEKERLTKERGLEEVEGCVAEGNPGGSEETARA